MTAQTTRAEYQQRLTQDRLNQFYGSDVLYRYPLFPGYRFTEGVKFMAEAGGAWWLIDTIFASQDRPLVATTSFQVWQLTISTTSNADLFCTDGNNGRVWCEHIEYTDFPLAQVSLYLTDHTLLLPTEY